MGYKFQKAHARGWCVVCKAPWRRGDIISPLSAKWVHVACKGNYMWEVKKLEMDGRL